MGHHTFPADRADRLEDAAARYRRVSAEELWWALASGDDTPGDPALPDSVLDLGSGTGFYTDEVATRAGEVYALDVQPAMHAHYREKGGDDANGGVPGNVHLVTGDAGSLPFADGSVDAAVSTMTYHEVATEAAVAELARLLAPGGRLAVADWTADGPGESGPPVDERYAAAEAVAALEAAGFAVAFAATRVETFLLAATAPASGATNT